MGEEGEDVVPIKDLDSLYSLPETGHWGWGTLYAWRADMTSTILWEILEGTDHVSARYCEGAGNCQVVGSSMLHVCGVGQAWGTHRISRTRRSSRTARRRALSSLRRSGRADGRSRTRPADRGTDQHESEVLRRRENDGQCQRQALPASRKPVRPGSTA